MIWYFSYHTPYHSSTHISPRAFGLWYGVWYKEYHTIISYVWIFLNVTAAWCCKLMHLMTKPTTSSVRLAKTQISLGICPVWSESLLCTQWVAQDPSFLHADSEDWSDWVDAQADRVFAGRTCHFIGFVWGGSINLFIFAYDFIFLT